MDKTFKLRDIFYSINSPLKDFPNNNYFIYKITNCIDGKSYVGDSKSSLHKRFSSSGKWSHKGRFEDITVNHPLYNSLRKYGIDNFTVTIFGKNLNMVYDEKNYITLEDSYYSGYNLNTNGKGSGGTSLQGKKAVNNGEYIKFINLEDISTYIKRGWVLGYGQLNTRDKKYNNAQKDAEIGIFSEKNKILHRERTRRDILSKSGIYSKKSIAKRIKNSTFTQRSSKIGIFSDLEISKTRQRMLDNSVSGTGAFSEESKEKRYNSNKSKNFWSSEKQSKRCIKGLIRYCCSIEDYFNLNGWELTIENLDSFGVEINPRKFKLDTILKYIKKSENEN